ncbi:MULTISPECIES: F0F1 ATP synthase subunit B [Clostridium]|jgi:F-type H+-transporting ATPase subunit b|uniref:F0F1 ATP synthase subunit B n=1 Tax=Clostridium TaxID=1485 RepID=UPI0002885A5E|nr:MULTISPECIES: F0F1 ATP synthase subunit B [Clostridium]MDF2503796.1 synthase, subunit b [Clostridium sp.]
MSGNLFTFFATIVNFIILLVILKFVLFKRVTKAIDTRHNKVKETIDKANSDREEAKTLKIQTEKNLTDSKAKGKTIVEEYKGKAEKLSQDIKKEASNEAELIMERAKKEVEREKEKAEDELKKKVVDLAVILSSKALEKDINEKEHRRLIEDFITKVGM